MCLLIRISLYVPLKGYLPICIGSGVLEESEVRALLIKMSLPHNDTAVKKTRMELDQLVLENIPLTRTTRSLLRFQGSAHLGEESRQELVRGHWRADMNTPEYTRNWNLHRTTSRRT